MVVQGKIQKFQDCFFPRRGPRANRFLQVGEVGEGVRERAVGSGTLKSPGNTPKVEC